MKKLSKLINRSKHKRKQIVSQLKEIKTAEKKTRTSLPCVATPLTFLAFFEISLTILLFFLLILNYYVRSLYSQTNSYDNSVTQCFMLTITRFPELGLPVISLPGMGSYAITSQLDSSNQISLCKLLSPIRFPVLF